MLLVRFVTAGDNDVMPYASLNVMGCCCCCCCRTTMTKIIPQTAFGRKVDISSPICFLVSRQKEQMISVCLCYVGRVLLVLEMKEIVGLLSLCSFEKRVVCWRISYTGITVYRYHSHHTIFSRTAGTHSMMSPITERYEPI